MLKAKTYLDLEEDAIDAYFNISKEKDQIEIDEEKRRAFYRKEFFDKEEVVALLVEELANIKSTSATKSETHDFIQGQKLTLTNLITKLKNIKRKR